MLKWIDQGVTNVNTLRARVNSYFTGLLDQAASKYKAHARSFVISFSILLTLILGTDSIQLAKNLWNNAELRTLTAGQAQIVIDQGAETLDFQASINALNQFSIIKIGWWQLEDALPDDSSILAWVGFILLKLLGLSLTAVAVSQGSSFWYDLLKKLSTSPEKIPAPAGGETEASG